MILRLKRRRSREWLRIIVGIGHDPVAQLARRPVGGENRLVDDLVEPARRQDQVAVVGQDHRFRRTLPSSGEDRRLEHREMDAEHVVLAHQAGRPDRREGMIGPLLIMMATGMRTIRTPSTTSSRGRSWSVPGGEDRDLVPAPGQCLGETLDVDGEPADMWPVIGKGERESARQTLSRSVEQVAVGDHPLGQAANAVGRA